MAMDGDSPTPSSQFKGTNNSQSQPQICINFSKGVCKFGDRCKFIHDHRNHPFGQNTGIPSYNQNVSWVPPGFYTNRMQQYTPQPTYPTFLGHPPAQHAFTVQPYNIPPITYINPTPPAAQYQYPPQQQPAHPAPWFQQAASIFHPAPVAYPYQAISPHGVFNPTSNMDTGTELVGTNIHRTTLPHKEEDMAFKGSTSSINKHSKSLQEGASYFRFIKEKGGSKPEELEKEMGIKMIFPTSRNEDSIIIEGTSHNSVARAAERIQSIIDEAVIRSNHDNTHFISLPLAIHSQLVNQIVNFQNTISQTSTLSDKPLFIEPKTLHLTVLMLRLYNEERVNDAVRILEGIAVELKDALVGEPVFIKLKGLDIMSGSQDKAEVLHVPVKEVGGEDRLLRVCKIITDAFIKGGLVFEKDCQRELKLHATVMKAGRGRTFDARGIFKKYGSKKWGKYHIPQVHLSKRFWFDADGYYHCCASIPLP